MEATQKDEIVCEFVSDLFDGYRTSIDIGFIGCVDDIITCAVSKLFEFLRVNNLKGLIKHLNMSSFKIDIPLYKILNNLEVPVIIQEIEEKSCDCDCECGK